MIQRERNGDTRKGTKGRTQRKGHKTETNLETDINKTTLMAHKHKYVQTQAQTLRHTKRHKETHTHTRTYIHKLRHTPDAHTHSQIQRNIDTHIHRYTHTAIHRDTRIEIDTAVYT